MQAQNLKEYCLVREEIAALKICITDYVRAVFAGVGVVLAAWGGATLFEHTPANLLPVAGASFGLALLTVFVLQVLMYKFISHNRFAGYSMCLSLERWMNEPSGLEDLIATEWCVEAIRRADTERRRQSGNERSDIVHAQRAQDEFDKVAAGSVSAPQQAIRARSRWKRFSDAFGKQLTVTWFLAKNLFGFQSSFSWGFPISLMRIFASLTVALNLFAVSLAWRQSTNIHSAAWIAAGVAILLQIVLWSYVCDRFHSIMAGHQTVRNFCSRFASIRKNFLCTQYGIDAYYLDFSGNGATDGRSGLEEQASNRDSSS